MRAPLLFVLAALMLVRPAEAQWLNYPAAPNLSAPAPTTADGTPDLSGVWMADGQTYSRGVFRTAFPESTRTESFRSRSCRHQGSS